MDDTTQCRRLPVLATPIRILLVDDSPDFLVSATRFLSLDLNFEVIGWATSGSQALIQVAQLKPDLVLMDIAMPDADGLVITESIKDQIGAPRVIILTFENSQEYQLAAERAQADGFVTKTEFGTHLQPLIHQIFSPSNC